VPEPAESLPVTAAQSPASGETRSPLRSAVFWLPLVALAAAAGGLYAAHIDAALESQAVLSTLNTLFCGAVLLIVAYLAASTFAATGDASVLVLGAGALMFGLTYVVVGSLFFNVGAAVAVHNLGVLLAGACFLTAAFLSLTGRGPRVGHGRNGDDRRRIAFAVVAPTLAFALIVLAAFTGLLPAFFVPGQGTTSARSVVLGISVLEFFGAAVCFALQDRGGGPDFFRWFSQGLALIGLGLGTVALTTPGSPLSWLGRAGQYAGGLCMLVAVVSVVKEAGVWTIPLQTALRESEQRYRELFEQMAQGVVYQDPSGRIVSANPAAERILGLTLDEMQGRTSVDPRWKSIRENGADFPGEDHPAMVALRTGEEVHGVVIGVIDPHRDSYTWMQVDAVPQRHTGQTSPYRVFTTFTDITARKLADDALREGEERFRRLFESMDEGFALHEMVFDDHGVPVDYRFLEVNPAFGRLTGLDPAAILGRTVREILPGVEPAWIEMYGRVVANGRGERFERKAADLGRWYAGYAYPAGEATFAVLFADVTERRLWEEELRRRSEDLTASNAELEQFNRLAVGREQRMIELKNEVNELAERLGDPAPYPLEFLNDTVADEGRVPDGDGSRTGTF
jgi:PAS domain S-box-containing protein